jgi:hypothetical protein
MITFSGFCCTTVITDLLLSLVIVFETKYVKRLFLELQTKFENVLILKKEGRKEKKDLRKKRKKERKI